MRLDKFLYFARFAKSRSKSAAMIDAGSFRIDGRAVASTHTEVRAGCTVTFAIGGTVRAIKIVSLPSRRGPAAEAHACYSDLIPD